MAEAEGGDLASPRFALALAVIALVALGIRIAFVVVVAPRVPTLAPAPDMDRLMRTPGKMRMLRRKRKKPTGGKSRPERGRAWMG